MDVQELLRGGAPFVADTSAWSRMSALPSDLRSLLGVAFRDDRLWITPIVRMEVLYSARTSSEYLKLESRLDALVPPRFAAYVAASKDLFAEFRRAAPIVQGLSLEEAFLDVGGLAGPENAPVAIAARLREAVRTHAGLVVSVGVGRTKTIAKIASNAAKPDGLVAVPPEEERAFMHPLAVEKVWGVGEATAKRLRDGGLATVGDMAALAEPELVAIAGKAAGRYLHAVAHGRGAERVRPRRGGRRSFGAQSALGRSRRTPAELDAVLVRLVECLSGRMRKAGRGGRTVVLRLRYGDYSRAAKSRTLTRAASAQEPILRAARELLRAATPAIEHRGITLIGITISNLDGGDPEAQLALPMLEEATG